MLTKNDHPCFAHYKKYDHDISRVYCSFFLARWQYYVTVDMILMIITLLNPIRSASIPNAFCGIKILKIDRGQLMCTDPQQAFSTIPREFSYIYNACFLSKVLKLNDRNRKMWLTMGLKESIKIKNKLYRKCKKYPSPDNEQRYKSCRNKLNSLLKLAE